MNKISIPLAVLASMLALTLSCQQKVDIEAEKAAIRVVLDNYVTSIENEDMGLYAKVMAHDPDMVNFGTEASERIVGWNALEKLIEAQNASLTGTKITVSDVTIKLAPGTRFAWATSLWNVKATLAGQWFELPVRCTWILEKQRTGWVIVHFHKSVGE
ncbi:MAG: nuclear transport factor 2 family protein [Candidatus Zixiibacteriota bacterium]